METPYTALSDGSKQTLAIPERTSSKRPWSLINERNEVSEKLKRAKRDLKPQASFDANFWTRAAEIEKLNVRRLEIQRKISLRDFTENGKSEVEWQNTEEARALFERIRAEQTASRICEDQAKKLNENAAKKRSLRASFMKLFATSKMGLNITKTGAGKRDGSTQSNFRQEMIQVYNSKYPGPEPWLWCPILGDWIDGDQVVAAHFFAYMHGQVTMDAIFGKKKTPELFSPKNGLMICQYIEKYFDAGYLVIVPLLPERPSKTQLATWLMKEPREYMTRVIDPNWSLLNQRITRYLDLRWKDLDGRPLKFRSDFRPAARYLYFHYCLQILRRSWKEPPQESKFVLKKEMGKLYWGTPGRYLPRNMLMAFVEELGHEYDQLLEGARCSTGEDEVLLAAATKQVKTRSSLSGLKLTDESEDDEDEDEDDDKDEDEEE